MLFKNRIEAGRMLAAALADYRDAAPIILGLPRGGVVVAAEVASELDAPLDLILVRKIGVPGWEELAMGAVVDGDNPTVVRNEEVIRSAGIPENVFNRACERELDEIERRRKLYMRGRGRVPLYDRVVIVVDDGLATGATSRAALIAAGSRRPKELVLAVPVASREAIEDLRREADRIVCLKVPEFFEGVGAYYRDFHQVSDAELTKILNRFPIPGKNKSQYMNDSV